MPGSGVVMRGTHIQQLAVSRRRNWPTGQVDPNCGVPAMHRRGSRLAFENGSTLSPGTFDGVQYTLSHAGLPIDTRRVDQYRSTLLEYLPRYPGLPGMMSRTVRPYCWFLPMIDEDDAAPSCSLFSLFPGHLKTF